MTRDLIAENSPQRAAGSFSGIYDLIIIGGGPAGLTSGIYAARARLNCLLLERQALGGQVLTTAWVENYPGFPEGIGGYELVAKMAEQAEVFGLKILTREVIGLQENPEILQVLTPEEKLPCRSAIVATGADYAHLGVPGEDRLRGHGVSYCATCDGAFFKDLPVAVVGGGDTALAEALFLTRFASSVTLIHRRDRLRAAKILQERAKENEKIRFLWNSQVKEIAGTREVEGIRVEDKVVQKVTELPVKGIFIFVGSQPNTGMFQGTLSLDEMGFVTTDEELRTSCTGVYAAGDCRKKSFRQIATAVGEGALAVHSAIDYLEHSPFPSPGKSP
jgi:thioredoxin reductase (NADPH)